MPDGPVTVLLDRAARSHPTVDGLVHAGRRWTWSAVRDLVDRAAAMLAADGVGLGDRVAVVGPATPATVVALFAAWRLGAVVVPIDGTLPVDVLGRRLVAVAPSAVVTDLRALDAVDAARPRLPGCRVVRVTDPARWGTARRRAAALVGTLAGRRRAVGPDDDVAVFDELLDDGPALVRQGAVERSSPAAIVWTAGTTGPGRPIVLTHGNLLANAVQVREWVVDLRDGRESVLVALPPWRGEGLGAALLPATLAAATIVLLEDAGPDAVARAIEDEQVTLLAGTPTLHAGLADRVRVGDLASLRTALSVGAPLAGGVVRSFEEVVPGARLRQAYGLAESTAVALACPVYGEIHGGPVGLPVSGTRAVVATLDDPGVLAQPGELGELLVAGPQVMAGAWRGPDEPVEAPGPWLRTGDAATVDEHGVFTLDGRVAELLVRDGVVVVPSRVERALRRHRRVADAVVLGVDDPAGGSRVVAVVVPAGRGRPSVRRLAARLGSQLRPVELPDEFVVRRRLPLLPTGEPDRRRLRRELAAELPTTTRPAAVRRSATVPDADDRRPAGRRRGAG